MTREEQYRSRIGLTNTTKLGEKMTIIEYYGSDNVIVQFPNGDKKKTYWSSFKKGAVAHYVNEHRKKQCVGEEHWNEYLEHFIITEYNRYEDVEVTFDDGTKTRCNYDAIKRRYVRNPSHGYKCRDLLKLNLSVPKSRTVYNNREGETSVNSQGEKMKIIRYFDANHIIVEFENTGYITEAAYRHFIGGGIKDLLFPSVYGIGCFGDGPYTSSHLFYRKWFDMMRRCYDEEWHKTNPTYVDAEVCPEWHNFQNFAAWCEKHFNPAIPDPELDKDLIGRGQKYYSPENCCILPMEINSLITKNEKIRGEYPIGVTTSDNMPGKFVSRLTDNDSTKTYKFYKICDTVEEAFNLYKQAKEKWIKEQAEKYRDVLEPRAYEALVNWEVRIDD